jgi:hypothetical protein
MILLLCRCLRNKTSHLPEYDSDSGVLEKHRKLAESIEMIYSSQSLLKSVLNLPPDLHDQPGNTCINIKWIVLRARKREEKLAYIPEKALQNSMVQKMAARAYLIEN